MLSDYLALGPLIVARLRAELPGLALVAELSSVDALESRLANQRAGAFIIYDGDRLGDSGGRGQAQVVWQRWLVVLAARNAAGQATGDGPRQDAGPLLSGLLRALQGWQPPSTDYRPLSRIAAPRPGYSPAFAYYPLAFECQTTTLGD